MVRAGEKTFYRVNVDATESSISWPDEIAAPVGLAFGASARGQMTQLQGNRFRPLTAFVYEVQTAATGRFNVTNFSVNVSGEPVEIPAASLDVVAAETGNAGTRPAGIGAQLAGREAGAARKLVVEIAATNVFLGQPFHVRVMLPAGPANEIEALREIQFNGTGLMTDKTASTASSSRPSSAK